jgi:hypothetical protein
MVVDLGAVVTIADVRLTWSKGRRRPARVEASEDGVSYAEVAGQARYVAVVVEGWRPGDAGLVRLAVS